MSLEDIFTLPSEYNDLRESLRALSENEIAPHAHAVDEDHRYPQEAHNALVKAGLFAAHVPTEFGGDGADALATCIIIEEVARVCGSASLIPAVNKLGSLPLILGGNKEQKERWLRPLAQGKGFSYCLSESEAGSDASALKAKAERKGDGWVINGSKKWISNAGESEFYTVIAQTDPSLGSKGITAFVLEKSDSGVTFGAPEKKMGFRGSPTREVYFDNVEISDDRRISEVGKGFAPMQNRLGVRRMEIACRSLGYARRCMDLMLKQANERKTFGALLAERQQVQWWLADSWQEMEMVRWITWRLAWKMDRGGSDWRREAAMVKLQGSEMIARVSDRAIQLLGGMGVSKDLPLEYIARACRVFRIFEGPSEVHRWFIARDLLRNGMPSE